MTFPIPQSPIPKRSTTDFMSVNPGTSSTIAAIATAPGTGGIGVIRLSGPAALAIATQLTGKPNPAPRMAGYRYFYDANGEVIDDGLLLCFPAPASFTGEDVAELQVHGGPVLLRSLLARCLDLGAVQAAPGQFSERAFANGKLDLVQAEAIADLIAASHERAARAARRSLDGVFSQRIDALSARLLQVRVHLEASIDFADEPIDTLGGAALREGLAQADAQLAQVLADAQRGQRLRDGLHAVLIGPPNAGKSSLLNALAGSERAIVTDIAGTTRDLLRETVHVDGLELILVDTAGLRQGGDVIEREGMRRATAELDRADLAIVVLDARDPQAGLAEVHPVADAASQVIWLHNKADLLPADAPAAPEGVLRISVREGVGLDALHQRLRQLAEGSGDAGEGSFSARARHVAALRAAQHELGAAQQFLADEQLELAAEALRQVDAELGQIVGRTLPDALLGHIFSSFCIGK